MVRINSFRFLEQITVRDTTTKQIWHFICNNWLIPSKGLDVAKYKLVQMKKLPYKYTLRVKSLQTLRDRHLWLSVYVCPRHSTFTRVQRLSCCFQFIMCAMLVNIMFYDIHMNQLQEDLLHEVFNFYLSHVIVGAQSALILFPISMLTAAIFRMASQHDMFDVRFGDKNDSSSYSSSEITGDEDSCAYINAIGGVLDRVQNGWDAKKRKYLTLHYCQNKQRFKENDLFSTLRRSMPRIHMIKTHQICFS